MWPRGNISCHLQDQVDMLTFQSQSLRDRAQRFEEALRKTTEEQLEVVLANLSLPVGGDMNWLPLQSCLGTRPPH